MSLVDSFSICQLGMDWDKISELSTDDILSFGYPYTLYTLYFNIFNSLQVMLMISVMDIYFFHCNPDKF